MTTEEKSRFDAAVQEAVTKIMVEQQQQFPKTMETAMKASLSGID